jgi:hypothetical protein
MRNGDAQTAIGDLRVASSVGRGIPADFSRPEP